jgi:leader peptidase (prepilin peptidase)/N-methyltransferase
LEWLWGALGWLLGGGLNWVVHELPGGRRLPAGPTCAGCDAPLAARQLTVLPLPGARGCARCGAHAVTPATSLEAPTALLFALLAWRYTDHIALIVYSAFTLILLLVLVIDLRHRWVYGVVCYPGTGLGLALAPLLPHGIVGAGLGALLGGGLLFALYWVGRLLYHGQEAMGSGDITIAVLVGSFVGVQRVLPALFVGGVLVAIVSLGLLATRRAGGRSYVPYGAGLCTGALAMLLWPNGT